MTALQMLTLPQDAQVASRAGVLNWGIVVLAACVDTLVPPHTGVYLCFGVPTNNFYNVRCPCTYCVTFALTDMS